jgi:outer membrane biogenesis lipoprotein LolB
MKYLVAVLVVGLLAACTEKPQRVVRSEHEAAKADQTQVQDQGRQRTLRQSESERIYQQGTLR